MADCQRAKLRWLRHESGAPAWNMAVDEALLIAADGPVLRTYGWLPHAVSLGYFQRLADFADLPHGTVIVRRLTGGGAIHHGDELTFALALDANCLPGDIASSYGLLHDAVLAALQSHSPEPLPVQRQRSGHEPTARPKDRWCFAEPGRDDLVTPAGKLLGSAQRRIGQPRPRVLHHGSLVLQRPALTPFVAALADHGPIGEPANLAAKLAQQLATALGLELVAGGLSATELALARELQDQRYANPAFTKLR